MKKTRFVLIGGFLGAGKTTLIGEIAKRYVAAGKTIGIITNDQAADLVDTYNLRSQGFSVGEVAGACFCCSFDDLVSTADSLGQEQAPDILLAEPVGSCTDLVATVVLPLQQLLGDRFEMAPFGVLLKPSHGRKILSQESDKPLSGFSPQAEYIFRKQLEEADYLMIGRSDQLSEGDQEALRNALTSVAGDVPVLAVSPKTGDGVNEVIGYIESPMTAGRRLLEIDYDTYADGEAELGWVNLTAIVHPESNAAPDGVELDQLAHEVVQHIADQVVDQLQGTIAHLKVSALGGDSQAVANAVSNETGVDVGLKSGRKVTGEIQIIVNARVAVAPEELRSVCDSSVRFVADAHNAAIKSLSAHSLRPGRPSPTHRVTTQ